MIALFAVLNTRFRPVYFFFVWFNSMIDVVDFYHLLCLALDWLNTFDDPNIRLIRTFLF
jgi:hypothetical protein